MSLYDILVSPSSVSHALTVEEDSSDEGAGFISCFEATVTSVTCFEAEVASVTCSETTVVSVP